MSTIPVQIAVEDELSEAVLRRMLRHAGRGYEVGTAYRRGGSGYLRRTIRGWNNAAQGVPFVLLTDLDQYFCPKAPIDEWLRVPQHPNLVIRVAVREVEAWLLADRANLASFLGVRESFIPGNVETLPRPKEALIDLARQSRSSELRDRIVPRHGSTARQGPDYNGCLVDFVASRLDLNVAATESPSLSRALGRLGTFQPVWGP